MIRLSPTCPLAQQDRHSQRLGTVRSGPEPTVLVADDDAGLRAAARMTLTAQGWTVIEASTPDECLALARRHRPDVLLLDVNFEGHRRDRSAGCRGLKGAAGPRGIHRAV